MNGTDEKFNQCSRCKATCEPNAAVCPFCGSSLTRADYSASVSSELKRLESGKLSFLNSDAIVSKFSDKDIEKFSAMPFACDEGAQTLVDNDCLDENLLLGSNIENNSQNNKFDDDISNTIPISVGRTRTEHYMPALHMGEPSSDSLDAVSDDAPTLPVKNGCHTAVLAASLQPSAALLNPAHTIDSSSASVLQKSDHSSQISANSSSKNQKIIPLSEFSPSSSENSPSDAQDFEASSEAAPNKRYIRIHKSSSIRVLDNLDADKDNDDDALTFFQGIPADAVADGFDESSYNSGPSNKCVISQSNGDIDSSIQNIAADEFYAEPNCPEDEDQTNDVSNQVRRRVQNDYPEDEDQTNDVSNQVRRRVQNDYPEDEDQTNDVSNQVYRCASAGSENCNSSSLDCIDDDKTAAVSNDIRQSLRRSSIVRNAAENPASKDNSSISTPQAVISGDGTGDSDETHAVDPSDINHINSINTLNNPINSIHQNHSNSINNTNDINDFDDSDALIAITPGVPGSAVVIPTTVKPRNDAEKPALAIDRLKKQGIFEPMTAHQEVSKSIEAIQALNSLIPESHVKTWDVPLSSSNQDSTKDLQNKEIVKSQKAQSNQSRIKEKDSIKDSAAEEDGRSTLELSRDKALAEMESRETIPITIKPGQFASVAPGCPQRASGRSAIAVSKAPAVSMPAELAVQTVSYRSPLSWILPAIAGILVIGIVFLLYQMSIFMSISPDLAPTIEGSPEPPAIDRRPETVNTIKKASETVEQALDFNAYFGTWTEAKLKTVTNPSDALPYLEAAKDFLPEDSALILQYAKTLVELGKYQSARRYISMLSRDIINTPAMLDLYYQSFEKDAEFMNPPTAIDDKTCDAISPLGGGSTLTFKCVQNDAPIGAFKPLQTRKQSNYRAEIAAWRLCALLECDFAIPQNRPIKIERSVFNKLYNRSKSSKKEAYRKELTDISWTKEGQTYYVFGTLKDWVPDFTRFPIEFISFWKGWLSQINYINDFPALSEALRPLEKKEHTSKLYKDLIRQSPNLTTEALASQISQVLTFDYLVGNWDRFSGVPEWWGVNCQFKNNQIVSIDNGAAFPSAKNDKVYDRFMMAERFSEHYIEAIRRLDKDRTFAILFPNPSKYETSGFELFWTQRQAVLDRIDKLIEKYGREHVLSFY